MPDEHFLIVRLAAVGDVVMASTLARRIRDERPGATITWLCGANVGPLVERFADVDNVLTVDERCIFRGSAMARARELLPLWLELVKRRFTHVMLLHVDRRFRAIVAPLVAPLVGARVFAQTPRGATGPINPVVGRYFGDEYARLLDGLAHVGPIVGHYPLARLRPPPSAAYDRGRDDRPLRVALVPGGARNILRESGVRRWPVEGYAAVAAALAADGIEVVLVGDQHDEWVRPSFASVAVTDRIGASSLPQTVDLLGTCDLVISHDTGPMHLARLAGARVLALFGPTMPSQFIVEDDRTSVLWGGADLACRPCYDGREFATCSANVCMSGMNAATVLQHARTSLHRARSAAVPVTQLER
jgi:heptosyltransferase-2